MADIRLREKSPITIRTLDRAAIAGDHLRTGSARIRENVIYQRQDDQYGRPEGYAESQAYSTAGSAGMFAGDFAIAMPRKPGGDRDTRIRETSTDPFSTAFPADGSGGHYDPGSGPNIRTRRRMLEAQRKRYGASGILDSDTFGTESRSISSSGISYSDGGGLNQGVQANSGDPITPLTCPSVRTGRNGFARKRIRGRESVERQAELITSRGRKRAISESMRKLARRRSEKGILDAERSIGQTRMSLRRIRESSRALMTSLSAGGAAALAIVMIFILFGAAFYCFGDESSSNYTPVSAEVEAYTPVIQKYANDYGIGEYVDLIKAVMMQESGGRGTDPMQCSESPYNKKYSHSPGSIKDPEYSIDCGVHYLADCLASAKCKSPLDMSHIRLALQGYNYGNEYISWAIKRDGGYTVENAAAFSDEQAKKHGWKSYGDKQYPAHVLRYYPYGNYNYGIGNTKITQVAAAQIGNKGGKKFWSWYGFNGRVAWCACYVSWCADQCGYIKAGVMPKFSAVGSGISWFKSRNQWQKRGYKPAPGDIIFFDWEGDGGCDHVGIVEKCDGKTIYTIEGNSGDACRRQQYSVNSSVVFGFGIPKY